MSNEAQSINAKIMALCMDVKRHHGPIAYGSVKWAHSEAEWRWAHGCQDEWRARKALRGVKENIAIYCNGSWLSDGEPSAIPVEDAW